MEDRPLFCCITCLPIQQLALYVAVLEIIFDALNIILAVAAYFTCYMTCCTNLFSESVRNWFSSILDSPDRVLSAYIFCLGYSMCQLYTGLILYSAAKTRNGTKCKLAFRTSIMLWFAGIIFWLYIVQTSHPLIFITVFIYSIRYANIAVIRRFLKELTVKPTSTVSPTQDEQSVSVQEEETRL